jgi:hypothetical protein
MKRSRIKLATAITSMVLILSLITAMPVLARVAQETITVNFNNISIAVNGQLAPTEFEPFIFQGRTYLPVRDVANAMGFGVTWEDSTNTVHLTSRANSNLVPNYPPHQPAQGTTTANAQASTPSPSPQLNSSNDRNNRPSNPAISLERAIEIAYADLAVRGINATFRRDSGMDWERGQWGISRRQS